MNNYNPQTRIIRKARMEDASALASLLQGLGQWHRLEVMPAEDCARMVAGHLKLDLGDDSHSVWVAELSERVVGYCAVHWEPYLFLPGPEGMVSELFLEETARGKGIGAALLAEVRIEAERRGCVRLGLLNSRGRESYQRGFYRKQGWVEREDMANFILYLKDY